ncbi:MAG: hypothetical protein LCH76_01375 [Actinobacteria bacterium]|nr:hypothetical protein [Actinomycetota bacterium]
MITVLVTMLVLSLLALTMASLVTSTAGSLLGTRNNAEARAAADAGMAALVAKARQTPDGFCNLSIASADESPDPPVYQAESGDCASEQVTFTSTGHGSDGAQTTIEAVYGYTEPSLPGGAGDMVFFGNTTFTQEVKTYSLDDDLLSIVIPTGDFTCMATIPGNILLGGDFYTKGNCKIAGGVAAGGRMDMSNAPDRVEGSVTMAGTGSNTVQGSIGGSLRTGGTINFTGGGQRVYGNVESAGDVKLGNYRIDGTLTLPASKTLTMNTGIVAGGISRPSSVTAPTAPTFDSWFDYSYKASDWPGFTVKTLVNSGSGPGTCGYYNNWPAEGWFDLASLSSPTVIDARNCSNLSANSGKNPVVAVKTDLVFVAKSFDLTYLTINSASGNHKLWWIVEDKTENSQPTCSGGAGNIMINHTVMAKELTTMAYTPCVVSVHGTSKWTGAFYGGSFNYGGGMTFHGDPIALPGQPTGEGGPAGGAGGAGAKVLTAVISQRDKG